MTCELHTQTWSTCKACFDNAHMPSAETLRDVATFVPGVPRGCPHCFGYDGSHTGECASLQGTQEASVTPADGFVRTAPWPDPTPEMLQSSLFERVWQCIKSWDINVPAAYSGYMHATGNHARAIVDAISAGSNPAPAATDDKRPLCEDCKQRDGNVVSTRYECVDCHNRKLPTVLGAPLTKAADSGWLCPRCNTVHAPYIRSCECRP